MKYRKKPIVIEAVQFDGEFTSIEMFEITQCHQGLLDKHMFISTLEGDMRVNPGDYIIKGIEGEFYACKESIFNATYEMVTEESK
jgi:hypothetical protein